MQLLVYTEILVHKCLWIDQTHSVRDEWVDRRTGRFKYEYVRTYEHIYLSSLLGKQAPESSQTQTAVTLWHCTLLDSDLLAYLMTTQIQTFANNNIYAHIEVCVWKKCTKD